MNCCLFKPHFDVRHLRTGSKPHEYAAEHDMWQKQKQKHAEVYSLV